MCDYDLEFHVDSRAMSPEDGRGYPLQGTESRDFEKQLRVCLIKAQKRRDPILQSEAETGRVQARRSYTPLKKKPKPNPGSDMISVARV